MKTHENNVLCFVILFIRQLEDRWFGIWRYVPGRTKTLALDEIKRICVGFYTQSELNQARDLLFSFYPWLERRPYSGSDSKERLMDDILCLISESIGCEIPIFVTDKNRIPTPKPVQDWLLEESRHNGAETVVDFMQEVVKKSLTSAGLSNSQSTNSQEHSDSSHHSTNEREDVRNQTEQSTQTQQHDDVTKKSKKTQTESETGESITSQNIKAEKPMKRHRYTQTDKTKMIDKSNYGHIRDNVNVCMQTDRLAMKDVYVQSYFRTRVASVQTEQEEFIMTSPLESETSSREGTRPTTPSREGTRPTTPSIEGTRPTTPSREKTRPTTPSREGDRPTTPSREGTRPTTPSREGDRPTTPSREGTRPTTPSREGDRPTTPSREGNRPTTPSRKGDRPTTPSREGDRPTTPSREGDRPTTPSRGEPGLVLNYEDDDPQSASTSGARPKLTPGEQIKVDDEVFTRTFRGLLNKLTPKSYHSILCDIQNLDVKTEKRLDILTDVVMEMVRKDDTYGSVCASLSKVLQKQLKAKPQFSNSVTYRSKLVTKCQTMFESPVSDSDDETRRVYLNNLQFMAHLHKENMLNSKAVHQMLRTLQKSEELEFFMVLLKRVGESFDRDEAGADPSGNRKVGEAKLKMNVYFEYLRQQQKLEELDTRLKFMIKDLVELRENNWLAVHAHSSLDAHHPLTSSESDAWRLKPKRSKIHKI